MKTQVGEVDCPRLFEVEALRDGRLTGAELVRFQNHVRACGPCAQEMQAMAGLADALRSTATSSEADELHVRRARTRLLAAFNESLVPEPRNGRAKLWLRAGAVAAVVVPALLALRPPPAGHVARVTSALDSVEVQADATAKWSRRAQNRSQTITLESGTLSIRVEHQLRHPRLLVLLPDGELEDIGTTFSVTAAAGQTTRVAVQDGAVIVRLRGLPARTLRAGEAWTPVSAPLTTGRASAAAESPAPFVRSAKSSHAAAPTLTPSPASATAPSSSVAVASERPDPAEEFRVAMSAFTNGDNARAARLFGTFGNDHGGDSRAEDAAYLRVLALQRAGNSGDTKQAAREYVARYPHGFRHAEVEPLSR